MLKAYIKPLALIAVLTSVYIGLTHYAEKTISTKVKAKIQKIVHDDPYIDDIAYRKIDASLWSLINHNFTMHDVRVSFSPSAQLPLLSTHTPLKIAKLTIQDFEINSQNNIRNIDLAFNGLYIENLAQHLEKYNPTLKAKINHVIPISTLSLSGTTKYLAPTETMTFTLNLFQKKQVILSYRTNLSQFKLPLINNSIESLYQAIEQSHQDYFFTNISVAMNIMRLFMRENQSILPPILKDLRYREIYAKVSCDLTYNADSFLNQLSLNINAPNIANLTLILKYFQNNDLVDQYINTILADIRQAPPNQYTQLKAIETLPKPPGIALNFFSLYYTDKGLWTHLEPALEAVYGVDAPTLTIVLNQALHTIEASQIQDLYQNFQNFLVSPATIGVVFDPRENFDPDKQAIHIQNTLATLAKNYTTTRKAIKNPGKQEAFDVSYQKHRAAVLSKLLERLGFQSVYLENIK